MRNIRGQCAQRGRVRIFREGDTTHARAPEDRLLKGRNHCSNDQAISRFFAWWAAKLVPHGALHEGGPNGISGRHAATRSRVRCHRAGGVARERARRPARLRSGRTRGRRAHSGESRVRERRARGPAARDRQHASRGHRVAAHRGALDHHVGRGRSLHGAHVRRQHVALALGVLQDRAPPRVAPRARPPDLRHRWAARPERGVHVRRAARTGLLCAADRGAGLPRAHVR
jgi:hypothetical protein